MYVVHYYENKNHFLTQLVNRVPEVGEDIKIKGRKGKVSNVTSMDENKFYVQVNLEVLKKMKLIDDKSKKKKR